MPLQAAFVRSEADYKVFQGRTLHLQFQANKEIKEAKVKALSASVLIVFLNQKILQFMNALFLYHAKKHPMNIC